MADSKLFPIQIVCSFCKLGRDHYAEGNTCEECCKLLCTMFGKNPENGMIWNPPFRPNVHPSPRSQTLKLKLPKFKPKIQPKPKIRSLPEIEDDLETRLLADPAIDVINIPRMYIKRPPGTSISEIALSLERKGDLVDGFIYVIGGIKYMRRDNSLSRVCEIGNCTEFSAQYQKCVKHRK